jgi:glycerol-3-phosphate dehydrogenase (NAD(P)+)
MLTTFAVLGDGAWGTAIALLLARSAQHCVRLWSALPENGLLLQQHRENVRLLPGIKIPETITLTLDLPTALADANVWISAIPMLYLRATLQRIAREWAGPVPLIVSLTKGIEQQTFCRPSEILAEILQAREVVVLSGPSHAEEVSRGLPTSVVAACTDRHRAEQVQQFLSSERFRVYTNLDPVGVELAGALKNVIGIAAGICIGLGYGDNALSALMTRGLNEMMRFGVALGANPATFAGLAGLGDLITTCISPHGRNRQVGIRLGRGEKLSAILAGTSMVFEGVWTARAVYERCGQLGIDCPIVAEVFRVLYQDKDPRLAVSDLMLRSPKGEKWLS